MQELLTNIASPHAECDWLLKYFDMRKDAGLVEIESRLIGELKNRREKAREEAKATKKTWEAATDKKARAAHYTKKWKKFDWVFLKCGISECRS